MLTRWSKNPRFWAVASGVQFILGVLIAIEGNLVGVIIALLAVALAVKNVVLPALRKT
jgi:hypothetical protein